MKLKELVRYIESHSIPGEIVEFYDSTASSDYYTSPELRYSLVPYVSDSEATIAIKQDNDGDFLYRESFLETLQNVSMEVGNVKIQIAMWNQDGSNWRGYLTDSMWSHITSYRDNVFALDNPRDDLAEAERERQSWVDKGHYGYA